MSLNVFVCIKQVWDARVPVEILTQEQRVCPLGGQPVYAVNPADRSALELGRRLVAGAGGSLCAVTVGPARARAALADCLWAGADRAVHILADETAEADPWQVSRLVAALLAGQQFDLVLCGERSSDGGSGLVGPALAEWLDLPQVTRAVSLEIDADARSCSASRLLERGDRELLAASLPALIAVSPLMCAPRYVPVRAQWRAAGEELRTVLAASLARADQWPDPPRPQIVRLSPPRLRPKKVFAPDSSLSAMDRVRLLAGGASTRKSTAVKASPERAADQIVEFLKERGIIGGQV